MLMIDSLVFQYPWNDGVWYILGHAGFMSSTAWPVLKIIVHLVGVHPRCSMQQVGVAGLGVTQEAQGFGRESVLDFLSLLGSSAISGLLPKLAMPLVTPNRLERRRRKTQRTSLLPRMVGRLSMIIFRELQKQGNTKPSHPGICGDASVIEGKRNVLMCRCKRITHAEDGYGKSRTRRGLRSLQARK